MTKKYIGIRANKKYLAALFLSGFMLFLGLFMVFGSGSDIQRAKAIIYETANNVNPISYSGSLSTTRFNVNVSFTLGPTHLIGSYSLVSNSDPDNQFLIDVFLCSYKSSYQFFKSIKFGASIPSSFSGERLYFYFNYGTSDVSSVYYYSTSFRISSYTYYPPTAKTPTVPEPPAGYTSNFLGWYHDEELTKPYTDTQFYEGYPLYPKFEKAEYSIKYNAMGGEVNQLVFSYNIDSGTLVLPTPVFEGLGFGGWFNNPFLIGEPVTTIPQGSTGNKEFYAKWIMPTCTVTFYFEGNIYEQVSITKGNSFNPNLLDDS